MKFGVADVLNFHDSKRDLMAKKIAKMSDKEKDTTLLIGTVEEKVQLASMKYRLNILATDSSPEVRKEVVKHSTDLRPFYKDPSSMVRHTVALRLKSILECTVPKIEQDKNGMPYVVDTLERQMINEMVSDLSIAVSTVAKQTLDDLKKREVKEAVNIVLNQGGLEDVSCSLAKDLEKSLHQRFLNNDIEGLPVRSANYSERKVGMDR